MLRNIQIYKPNQLISGKMMVLMVKGWFLWPPTIEFTVL
jgi:hypothetical protein